ncbi:MAG TPA: CsgG/HfaB family protein [Candidatus Angelobacter sp.]|nr:CsgG/HfaB family protein [Candidatus Angelobacter sp.]
MRRRVVSLLVVTTLFASIACAQKKRVAIMDFEYATVHSNVAAIFGTDVDIGKGIGDMLVDRLVNDGKYSVIERKALDKILAEQNFSNSDRADPSSAAKIGKLLGVNAIIVGSITQFGRDDKSTGVGGGGFGRYVPFGGGGGVKKSEGKAVVQVTARLVDVNTGEILASAQGLGQSKRSSTSLGGFGVGSGGGGGGALDMHSSNFGATIIGEATNAAVTDVAAKLDASADKLPTTVIAIDGMVADVSGNTLILNVGKNNGLQVGDTLKVNRTGKEIKDPATGKVLRRVDTPLGQVTLTQVDDTSSEGTYAGAPGVKVGDHVKR